SSALALVSPRSNCHMPFTLCSLELHCLP
ncbi:hypothetical protein GCK32_016150, partial [Trichostrongylus colubriformis]